MATPKKRLLGKASTQGSAFHFSFFLFKFLGNRAAPWGPWNFHTATDCRGTSASLCGLEKDPPPPVTELQATGSCCDCHRVCPTKQTEERHAASSHRVSTQSNSHPQPVGAEKRGWRKGVYLSPLGPQPGLHNPVSAQIFRLVGFFSFALTKTPYF